MSFVICRGRFLGIWIRDEGGNADGNMNTGRFSKRRLRTGVGVSVVIQVCMYDAYCQLSGAIGSGSRAREDDDRENDYTKDVHQTELDIMDLSIASRIILDLKKTYDDTLRYVHSPNQRSRPIQSHSREGSLLENTPFPCDTLYR